MQALIAKYNDEKANINLAFCLVLFLRVFHPQNLWITLWITVS